MTPCKGIFADVAKIKNDKFKAVEDLVGFKEIFKSYNAFKNDEIYGEDIAGIFFFKNMIFRKNMIFLGFSKSAKLHRVQISFATPTFDRITKDEKANLATKLSAVGGTLGLLTGFSFIGGVVFVEKILMGLVGKLQEIRNKKKIASEETNQTVIMVESAEKKKNQI